MHYQIYVDGNLIYDPRTMSDELAIQNPKLSIEANSSGQLTFDITPTHPYYQQIVEFYSIVEIYRNSECWWRGRVIESETAFDGISSKTCEGCLSFLNDIQYPASDIRHMYTIENCMQEILSVYNSSAMDSHKILLGELNMDEDQEVSVVVFEPHDYCSCMDMMAEITEQCGGYLTVRIRSGVSYIDYDQYPNIAAQKSARFGINLLDLKRHITIENYANVIIPLGEPISDDNDFVRYDLSTLQDGEVSDTGLIKSGKYLLNPTEINIYGRIEKSIIYEDITNPQTLLAKGCVDLLFSGATMQLDASFIDMAYIDPTNAPIDILDGVSITYNSYATGDTLPITAMEIEFDNPQNNKYSISESKTTTMIDYILKR